LSAGNGNDQVLGGTGNDYIEGNAGDNLLVGGQGADEIHSGSGRDILASADYAGLPTSGSDGIFNGPPAAIDFDVDYLFPGTNDVVLAQLGFLGNHYANLAVDLNRIGVIDFYARSAYDYVFAPSGANYTNWLRWLGELEAYWGGTFEAHQVALNGSYNVQISHFQPLAVPFPTDITLIYHTGPYSWTYVRPRWNR
jgi:Ca2+-binding RTX toxin-like protein